MASNDRRSLTPWAIRDRLERRVEAKKEVRLRWETAFVLLEALRAYIANPSRDRIAAIICMRQHVKDAPCEPLCRRCIATAYELKQLFRGEVNPFGDESGHRRKPRSGGSVWSICLDCQANRLLDDGDANVVCRRCGSANYTLTANDPRKSKSGAMTGPRGATVSLDADPGVDAGEQLEKGSYP